MSSDLINLDFLYGHCELVQVQERVGDKIHMGGYTIEYDRNGIEKSRSAIRWNVTVHCGDEATARSLAP